MSKSSNEPSTLSAAIEKLENTSQGKAHEFKQVLEKDYKDLRKALDDLKPYLSDLKKNVEDEVKHKKHQVENKVKESPWIALGITGLLALIVGFLLGSRRKD